VFAQGWAHALDVAGWYAVEDFVRSDRCHAAFRWESHPRVALFDGESCRGHGWRLGLDGCNRPAPQISPTCGLPREANFWGFPVLHCVTAAGGAARPSLALRITDKARWARPCITERKFIMANIGNFTAQKDSFTGTVRTLTLNVKVKIVPNTKESENAPDYRIVAGTYEIGAAWKKVSKADRPYLSATLDDPSFPATIYARLVEAEDGVHNLIWSRSKGD
jgi:uncharacterized protein (DUF736 family)